MTLRRLKNAVTPQAEGFLLHSPHTAMIPLSAKKLDALMRLLPHIPEVHHSFYDTLPRQSGPSIDEIERATARRPDSARKQRILEDDEFLAKFDRFLPIEAQKELENTLN